MVLSGGRRVEQGMIHNPTGFLGALSNVTKSAEDFVTGRIGGSLGESTFAMLGAGGSPAASMIAAGSGALSKLTMFAANAQSAMGQQQQVPGLSYDPVGEFMKMQVATPNFGSVASAQQSSASSAAASSGSPSFSVDGGGSSSKEATEMTKSKAEEFSKALQNQKGYSKDDADALVKMMSEKAKDDVGDTKKLVDSIPNRGDGDWHKKFAQWYGTKIGGKDAKEVAEGIEKDVYGKGDEIKLKRLPGDDRKESAKKGAPVTAEAFEVTQEGGGLSVGDKIFRDKSTGQWMKAKTNDDTTLVPIESLEGSEGSVSSNPGTESPLKLKSDYRAGVEDMKKVGEFMDHLDTKLGITRPGKAAAPVVPAVSQPGSTAPTAKMDAAAVKSLQDIIDGKDSAISGFATVSAIDGQKDNCQIEIKKDKNNEFKNAVNDNQANSSIVNTFDAILTSVGEDGKIVFKFGDKTVEIPYGTKKEEILAKLKEAVADSGSTAQ